jgi:hypothetical protein
VRTGGSGAVRGSAASAEAEPEAVTVSSICGGRVG